VIWIVFSIASGAIDLIIALVIWAVIGWLAGNLVRGEGNGVLSNILLGLIGGVVGGFLFSLLGVGVGGGLIGTIIVGVVGAAVVLLGARLLSGKR
ncbi:MAG: GlsB/YeaQ/YmgE family stress response membrane protein, partial [Chloroflexota bacterium]|nr:GlsB/YeaQ/YmgE family stress response membrane protein [Chloroflexota bacterium]